MSETRARRWPIRLAKLSPLIAAALVCLILFTMPLYLLPYFLDFSMMTDAQITPEMRAEWVGNLASGQTAEAAKLFGDTDSFDTRTGESWELVADVQDSYVTTAGIEPLALPAGDEAFAPLVAYEEAAGARVWAWTLTDTGVPSVVASAVGNPKSLESAEDEVGRFKDGNDPYMPKIESVPEYLWNNSAGAGALPPVNTQLYEPGGGGGMGGEDYSTTSFTVRQAGALWFVAAVLKPGALDSGTPWSVPSELKDLDPRSEEYRDVLEKVAADDEVNIFVMGPLTTGTVPLRAPAGGDPADAERLGTMLWPAIGGRADGYNAASVSSLTPEEAELAGGKAAAYVLKSMYNSSNLGAMWFEPDEIAPQTVLYVAVYDESPVPAVPAITRAWRGWQRFVSMWFPYLIGGAFALLLVSLIISPTVFVIERRRAARERMAAELEEMRRDAHDKVYNRLSALSKRVAAAGDEATTEFASSLGAIANDIRGTVGELQGILGDSAHHTDAVLTNQPLGDQIASVCSAQAARLGVQVGFAPAPDVPEVAPALGWDLQCVAEEAITNAVRHGAATRVAVSLAVEHDGSLALTIVDNGSGSSVLSAGDASGGSTGLAGMQARVAKHGGRIDIVSGTVGTSVVARVPVD